MTGRSEPESTAGQLMLSWATPWPVGDSRLAPQPPGVPEERSDRPVIPVECLWGCRGTESCLCGQGELSDDPLWIEND